METLISNQEEQELKRIRSMLFPAIGIQIITGFNVYPTKENSEKDSQDNNGRNIRISYLHEDILEDKLHYIQIKNMLEKYCDQIKTQRIKHKAIDRFSSYRLEIDWRAEQYFLVDQTSVKEEEVDDLIRKNITVIGCGSQNELIIECERDALEYILKQFRLYANRYEINSNTGEYVLIPGVNERKQNPNKIWDKAWETPCIIVHAEKADKIKTYERVRKILFGMHNGIASLIIGNKWDTVYEDDSGILLIPSFKEYLTLKGFRPNDVDDNHFANKIFFEWINEVNWKRVAKTIEMHGHMFKDIV